MAQSQREKAIRRRVAFSLRFWLLGLTVIGLALGAWASRAKRQHDAVAGLRELGGSVSYGDAPAWLPGFLVEPIEAALGPDSVRSVHTAQPPNPWRDATPHLKRMPGLRRVWFYVVPGDYREIESELPGVEVTGYLQR